MDSSLAAPVANSLRTLEYVSSGPIYLHTTKFLKRTRSDLPLTEVLLPVLMPIHSRYLGRKAAKRSHSLLHHHSIESSASSAQGKADLPPQLNTWCLRVPAAAHTRLVEYSPNCTFITEMLQSSSSDKPLITEADSGQSWLSTYLASKTRQTDLAHLCLSTDWGRSAGQHHLCQCDPVHWHNVHHRDVI